MRLLVVTAFMAAAACAGAPPRGPAARETAVLFHDLPAYGKPFPQPLVRGTVNGVRALMLVDTGGQVTSVAAWFARQAHVAQLPQPMSIVDPGGNEVTLHLAQDVRVEVDGLGKDEGDATLVVDLPPHFEYLGIGVILAPQSLVRRDDAIRVDLGANTMTRVPAADALGPSAIAGTRVCAYDMGGLRARTLVGDVIIDGVPATLDIDTGSNKTGVIAESFAAAKLAQRPNAGTARSIGAGGAISSLAYEGVLLERADRVKPTTVYVAEGRRNDTCHSEGQLGLPELAGCALVIGLDAFRVICPP